MENEHKCGAEKKGNIKIGFWNIAGINNKDAEFWEYITTFDIIGLTETWAEEKDRVNTEKKLPLGYKWKMQYAHREMKKGRAKGGILTGVRNEIQEKNELQEREVQREEVEQNVMERKVKIEGDIWRIITIYSPNQLQEINNTILHQIEGQNEEHLLIGGDLNARIGEECSIIDQRDGTDKQRKSKDKKINNEGKILTSIVEEKGWVILNGNIPNDEEGEFTYIGPKGQSVIDYTVTNEKALTKIKCFEIEPRIESDHQPLAVQLTYKGYNNNTTSKNEKKEITDWSEEGINKYKTNLEALFAKDENREADIEDIKERVKAALPKKYVYGKQNRRNNWWSKECKQRKTKVRKTLIKWKRGEVTKEEYIHERREYKTLCENLKNKEKQQEENEIRNIKNDNDIWKYINKEKKQRATISERIDIEEWKQHFKDQLEGYSHRKVLTLQTTEKQETEEITEDLVIKTIKKLKKKKASGEDGIQNEAWMNATDNVIKKLTKALNNIWKNGGIPSSWKKGLITPIYKKGNKHSADNYRGITLLDTCYKIYATILEDKLTKEIEEQNILPDTQAGFRKGRSTIDNIYILNQAIEKELKKDKGKIYVLFADLKAAFDGVNRHKMIEILRNKGVNKTLVNRIAEIYEETVNVVAINGKKSTEFWTTRGVRQGCPLSPTLFAMYLSDLEDHMAKGQTGGAIVGTAKFWTLAYADDLACVARSEAEMHSILKRLEIFFCKKDLILNVEKTKMMKFMKKSRYVREQWTWQGKQIEQVKEFKYLGYTFKSNNSAEAHIRDLKKRANIAMAQIWGIGERKFKTNFRMRMLLFDYTVRSMLMYATEVWGWKEHDEIEAIQTKYIRWILGLEQQTPKYIILEETKRDKLKIEAGKRAMKYEAKIRTQENNRILQGCWKEIRKNDKNQDRQKQGRWEKERQQYYEHRGYSTEEVENKRSVEENIMAEIIQRDQDIQKQEQENKINKSKYNPEYKNIKTLSIPRYLKDENKKKKLIARYRCGNEENKNKYWKREIDRKCRLCGKQEETIEHLLRDCEKMGKTKATREDILADTGQGLPWMLQVEEERRRQSDES